jgi:hypothetical protein
MVLEIFEVRRSLDICKFKGPPPLKHVDISEMLVEPGIELAMFGLFPPVWWFQSLPLKALHVRALSSGLTHCMGLLRHAGLIKICLAYENGMLPGNLHYNTPNPGSSGLADGTIQVCALHRLIHSFISEDLRKLQIEWMGEGGESGLGNQEWVTTEAYELAISRIGLPQVFGLSFLHGFSISYYSSSRGG